MKLKLATLLAGALSAAVFMPSTTARACDGACAGGTTTVGHRHLIKQAIAPGAGEGLNNGINLSLDQPPQGHSHINHFAPGHKGHIIVSS